MNKPTFLEILEMFGRFILFFYLCGLSSRLCFKMPTVIGLTAFTLYLAASLLVMLGGLWIMQRLGIL